MIENIARKNILDIQPYVPGRPIEEVQRELKLKQVIKLASNENPFGPSSKVLKAIQQAARNLNRYPDGQCFYLRQELARRLKIKPAELIFGNGSDEIIVLAVKAFVEPGDEVVVAKPSFLIYELAAKIASAAVREVPLQNFHYDLEGMRAQIGSKTKIVFIGNPDNPAGTYVTATALEKFLQAVPSNVIIFVDEAYYEFVTAKDYPNTMKLLKTYKNLIVTRTFSKMYGLAGLRVGYGMADERIMSLLNRVREPFNVNSLAQVAALACLKDQAYYRRIAKILAGEKEFLYKSLKALGVNFEKSWTNFILIDVNQNGSQVSRKLLERGVIVRDMEFWGLKNYIRVTMGSRKENQKFLSALEDVL